jgi:hypothetical protein
MPRMNMADAQAAALGFLTEQASYVEAQVVKVLYPDIQYPSLIPVDTSAPEWAKSVTYFSMDMAGQAEWFNHNAKDLPLADVSREKFERGIKMAGIGYRYTLEELGQAMMTGVNLSADRAEAARRAYEEFLDDKLLRGDSSVNWTGLINDAGATSVTAAEYVTGSTTLWSGKPGDNIIADINDAITGIWTNSKQIELGDTVLLPPAEMARIATMPRATAGASDMSVLDWVMKYNVYTMQTGQPLMVRSLRGLETAGTSSSGRMVVYRRDPQVLKAHIPMPHRFLPVWQTGPITFDVPGIFRFGGLEVRRPGAVRYVDGISAVNLYS